MGRYLFLHQITPTVKGACRLETDQGYFSAVRSVYQLNVVGARRYLRWGFVQ